MSIDTRKLRDTAQAAKEFASVGVVTHPHTAKAHINGLADAVATCCGEIDALEAEIARLNARCDARGEQIERLRDEQAEKDVEIRSLKHELASMRFRLSGMDMRPQAPIARAAISGEGK